MKEFFQNLFGRKPAQHGAQKPATSAPATPIQRPEFDPFKKGDVIGGTFEVLRKLGEGGFGVVYLVRHRESGELFALKTFRDEFLTDSATREAFKKEALLWTNLQDHPCIVAARWVQEFHGRLFVMMDYLPADSAGRVSLGDYFGKGPLDANAALKWAIQFCQGMEHATAHGIRCHRDIKPGNILIAQDGTLKVADFGLVAVQHELTDRERLAARLCNEAGIQLIVERAKEGELLNVIRRDDGSFGFSMISRDGKTICGTPGYMAPELYRGEMADLRSDIYSFGLVLWQMATGNRQPPFMAAWDGDMGTFMRAIYEQQMSVRVPAVDSPFSTVIGRCLHPQPAERYSGFRDLRKDLEAIFERRTNQRVQVPQPEEQSATFWSNRGGSLCSLGRFEEAIACFDKALEIEPGYGHAWSNKGVVLYSLGRNRESLQCFERALKIDSRDAMAWSNAGNVLSTLGQHEDALRCCDKSLALDPHNPTTWNNKGNAHHALGRFEEAIVSYQKAVAVDQRDARGWYNQGGSLRALGRHSEAIHAYAKALAINPHSASACYSKAESEYTLKQWRDAAASYRRFIELKSSELANFIPTARQRLQELESKGF